MSWMAEIWRQSAVRLTITLCVVFIVISVAAGIYMIRQIDSDVRDFVDGGLLEMHRFLITEGITPEDLPELLEDGGDFYSFAQGYRGPGGAVLGALRPEVFDSLGFATLSPEALFTSGSEQPELQGQLWDVEAFEAWRVYVTPFKGGTIALTEPIGDIEVALDSVFPVIQLIALPMIGVTLLAGLILGWQQQRRVDRIHRAVGALAVGDFTPPDLPDPVRDDLDDVMVGIGRAAQQLEQSFGQMRRFSQSMAHELRTPLARLRAEIEALPESDSTEAALAQSDQVIRIFDAVQRIARLSGPGSRAAFSPVDLGQVGQMIADLYEDVCQEQGRALLIDSQAPATVSGDFQLVIQMVSNLVENALHHGQGAIHIGLNGAGVTVSDSGAGVDPATLDRLFQPFEKSQSDGTGLGLALVQAIAGYHGATTQAETGAGIGVRVCVNFPEGDAGPG